MTRNTELFDKIAAKIEAEPQRYDQLAYYSVIDEEAFHSAPEGTDAAEICGTAHCVAGWAVVLNGDAEVRPTMWGKARCLTLKEDAYIGGGSDYDFHIHAERLLGLTEDEADDLFDGHWLYGASPAVVAAALRAIGRGAPITQGRQQ